MKVWKNIREFKGINPAVTVGSFDGVHLGHLEVLKQLKQLAKQQKGESVVFTFSPHPVQVLKPDVPFIMLTTIEEKIQLFEKAGIDHLIIFPFDKDFSNLSYSKFIEDYLIGMIHMHSMLIGYDNKIGRNREGDFGELVKLSKRFNFSIEQQTKLLVNEQELSSTHIRSLLNEGKLLESSKLLGYAYIITGEVVHGQHLGNKLGFPTANILPPKNKFIPANGVYAITVKYNGNKYLGMMNIGIRPTINDSATKPIIEAHLFNFNDTLYGEKITISIIRKLRIEYKFESIDALRSQLKKDKEFALETLNKEFGLSIQ